MFDRWNLTVCSVTQSKRANCEFDARLPDRPAPQGHGHRHPAAREAGVAIPLGALTAERRRRAGHGPRRLDHSALLLLVEQLSGRGSTAPTTSNGG